MQARDRELAAAAGRLLTWYDVHARALPWRSPPGKPSPHPYRVWLSEVMLQQTTVSTVTPRFAQFVARWPTVEALAQAEEAEIMAAWAGLGYYRRARSLIACAREVAGRGGFPTSEACLRELPGIGAYTAAAIAAIAFGQRAVVVDANVERVVTRLFAIDEPLPRARKAIRNAADGLTPERRPGDHAQAMMDLGARICTPRAPRCSLCPLQAPCLAYASGEPERFPVRAPKAERPLRRGRAFWVQREGAVWLVRRPREGLLGGMRALPDDGWSARRDGHGALPFDGDWSSVGSVHHSFTHFRLEMDVMIHRGNLPVDPGAGEWWPLDRLKEAGLPTVFAKAASMASSHHRELPFEGLIPSSGRAELAA